MKLVYAYIGNFRNIRNQEVHFSDDIRCSFRNGNLEIVQKEPDSIKDAVFGNSVLRDLSLIVGETGAGKTNLLQLLGMDEYRRDGLKNNDSYLILFAESSHKFIVEICNLYPKVFNIVANEYEKKYRLLSLFEIVTDDNGQIASSTRLDKGYDPRTYIINCFDRTAFASPPCVDEHHEGIREGNYFPRIVSPYGRTNIGIACEALKRFINRLPADNFKRNASLKISVENWRYKLPIDLPEEVEKEQYWTYQDKRLYNFGTKNRKKSKQSPKNQFLHDLVADFAIYLRKWAETVYEPEEDEIIEAYERGILIPGPQYSLPDFKGGGGSVDEMLSRLKWLGSYIDCHTDEILGERGLVWQITDDIKDIYLLLNRFDDKYFTEEAFSLPIVEMDFDNPILRDLFERITAYRPDELGIFTKELLPYEIVGVSSGEYQYAKTLGAIDEFCLKLKVSNNQKGGYYQPDFILLLDEPEAYMHPEMCRRFLATANEILSRRSSDSAIQIIMTTHSPFMLSDVVSSQVIRLKQDEFGYCKVLVGNEDSTFAAGIHSIMARDFFLDYTIGEYSRQVLTDLLEQLKIILTKEQYTKDDEYTIERAKIITPEIGDKILRRYFESLLEKL